ncbi:hypothetical protein H0H93_009198 [Arthromyces matolae]|nr:hypothetical protein H0H93_009198 [Arthromyces matolae]
MLFVNISPVPPPRPISVRTCASLLKRASGIFHSLQNGAQQSLPIAPFVSDGLGRRATMFIGSLIMLAGVAVQTAATTPVGFGLQFCINSAPLLLIELAYPTQVCSIVRNLSATSDNESIARENYINLQFKLVPGQSASALTMLPALVFGLSGPLFWYKRHFPCCRFIPESPRYLVSKGYEGKAAAILAKYHANAGDERDPLVVFELAQIRHAIRMEEESNNSIGITDTKTKALLNGGLQTKVVLGFDLRNASFGCWTITNALYINFSNTAAAKATVPLIFLFYAFYNIAYSPVLVAYTLEILPYRIRAKGFAVMNLTVMLTIAFNQFINPVAIEAIGWWYYLVYCGWLIFELVFVVIFVIETKGRTLEETAVLFDGEEPTQDLLAMGGEAATMTMESRGAVIDAEHRPSQAQIEKKVEFHEMRQIPYLHRDPTDFEIRPQVLGS